MNRVNIIILATFLISTTNYAIAKEEDKSLTLNERMIRLETKVDEGFKRVDERFKSLNQRIDDLNIRIDDLRNEMNERIDGINRRIDILINLMLCGFGIILTGMFGLVGFVIWDRRTVVAPVAKELKEVVKQEELILEVLKRYGKTEPKLANVIEAVGVRV